jgi:phosphoribosylformylglycinamidine (FGAM) synthase PurS component
MKVQIQTKLRKGIKDIEGETILNSVGKDSKITHISVGQIFYLEVKDDVNVDDIAKNIFVNELLYDYEIKYVD